MIHIIGCQVGRYTAEKGGRENLRLGKCGGEREKKSVGKRVDNLSGSFLVRSAGDTGRREDGYREYRVMDTPSHPDAPGSTRLHTVSLASTLIRVNLLV